ncbi:MAG TPA: ABC transporter substrate-binding protein, partial [Candidatus Edwardsbacteria bacterium]|nr:ABC transporter substrate-binding protein [Candidatus Edwardsbacteria bacterium]
RWRSLQDSMGELRKTSDQEEQIAGVVWENLEQLFDNIHAIGGNLDATGSLLASNKADTGQIAGHLDRSELDLRQLQGQWGGFGEELAAIARSIGDLMVSAGYLNSFTEEIKLLSFYESIEVADLGRAGRDFLVFVDQTRELSLRAKADADQLVPLFEDLRQKFGQADRIIARITGIIGDNLASITQARWSLERSQEAASQFELIGQEAGQTIAAQNAKRQEVYQVYTSYTASYKQVSASLARLLELLGQGFAALSELAQAEGRLAGVFDREAVAAAGGRTLRLSLPSDPITLDPAFLTDATSNEVAAQLHAGLVQFDDGARVMPAVARSWSISGDGLTWTFSLRKGVTFHHGRELVADDVKYSWERLLDPAVKSPNGLFVEIIDGAAEFRSGAARSVAGIKVVDDHCLRVTLRQPYMPFLANLAVNATAIVPREHTGRADFGTNPVGAGPFRMRQWQPGKQVAVERYDGYYEQQVSLGAVEWQVGLADEQRRERLLAGGIDTADIHARDSGPLAAQGGFVIKEVAALNIQYLCINVSHPTPFQHKLVRQALNCAIDKQALIDATELRGEAIVARGTFPPRLEAFNPALQGYPYDPERAKRLLAEAGFAGGLPGQYLLDVRDIKAQLERGTMVVDDCRKVGIRLKLNPLGWKELLDRAYGGESLLSFRGWSSDNGDPDNFLTPLFHSRSFGKPGNTAFFTSAEIDGLLEKALAIRNPVERLALYREIEAKVVEEAPWVFLYHSVKFAAMQPRLHGYRVRPFGAPRLKDCWLE